MENTNDYRYRKAKERVECIKSFHIHFMVYLIVMLGMAYLNFLSTSFPWMIFPALGWGIGLAAHGMEAYGYYPFFGKDWETRKIKELMDNPDF